MYMKLPEKSFRYVIPGEKKEIARTKGGILRINQRGLASYRSIIYNMSYRMYPNLCVYCGSKLKHEENEENELLDYCYPKRYSGPTITDNLKRCCSSCMSAKKNLTRPQFEEYLRFTDQNLANAYYLKIEKRNSEIEKSGKYLIPKKWMTERKLDDILVLHYNNTVLTKEKWRLYGRTYYEFGKCGVPIILDKNDILLDGALSYKYLKWIKKESTPVIKLDNVQVVT